MPSSRPRASDFDYPDKRNRQLSDSPTSSTRIRQTSFSPPPSRRHHDRRPSPSYETGNRQEHPHRERLTPDRSLDHLHRSDPDSRSLHQHRPRSHLDQNAYRQGGRDDYFETRRLERENSQIAFWPKSPKHAYGQDKKHSSSKQDRHTIKDKQHLKSSGKNKEKERSKKKKKHRSPEESDDQSDRSDGKRWSRKHKPHRHKRRRTDSDSEDGPSQDERLERTLKGKARSVHDGEEEDIWAEKAPAAVRKDVPTGPPRPAPPAPEPPARDSSTEGSDTDAAEVGPMPYNPVTGKAMDPKEFGRALRPGEGSAMAAFIEAGERIPRRGEIGLTGTQIEKYENAGYVMSGSRHRRMNAVRIRKENQVISAEEKRGILKMQAEEKAKREGQIISSFRELVDTKLQET